MSTRESLLQEIAKAPEPLLSEVLDFLRQRKAIASHETVRSRQSTLAQAAGLLKTNNPAPTDQQVAQWLEEERLRKHA